jgi:hydroxymethylpyrimidine pyrophosphatase-like HAD family hydrolase
MNTGQSFMSIGAIILLSLVSLSFNSAVLQNTTLETENKVYLTAFSLADDLIEEIKQKAFDEKTIDFQAINVNQLTYPPNKESGEVWPYFDDIDDYNNYAKPVSLPHAEGYTVSCIVNYSTANGDDIFVRSFYKKVIIKVTSDYMSSPLYLKYVFSLHSKN